MVIGAKLRCFGMRLENEIFLVLRFCKKPRSKFKILEKRGEVAYQLEVPPQLSDVHDVFYVSQLKKCLCVPEE
jgi:hypothetical protein